MPSPRPALPDRQWGLLRPTLGALALTPDSLLVRLIDAEPYGLLVWRGLLQALGVLAILAVLHRGRVAAPFLAVGGWGLLLAVVFAAGTFFFILALSLTAVADVLVIVAAAPLAPHVPVPVVVVECGVWVKSV